MAVNWKKELTAEDREFLLQLNNEEPESESEIQWPEPEEIKPSLLPVEKLDPGIIPGPLREWLTDIAYRMQCPVEFVAVAAIVAAGALIGAGCGIRPKEKDDWQVIPNLWGGVIARPSMLKTPALADVLKQVKKLELEAKEHYEEELLLSEADAEILKAQKDAVKAKMLQAAKGKGSETLEELRQEYALLEQPEAPARRRFITNDATIEKMAELLNENERGILYFRDELVGFLVNLDREDRQADRAFYLEAWNGFGSYTTDRIGRGTIDTNNLCVSILGGIQPSKLTGYLMQAKDDLQNDGLLQRFQLLVYPDEPEDWKLVDEYPNKEARERAFRIFNVLASMDFIEHGAAQPEDGGRPYFHFTDDAQGVFNNWLTDLQEKLQKEDNSLMVEHLSKYRSLMPSLALIFHLIDISDGQATGGISSTATLNAMFWCEYLETHARRIYGMVGDAAQRAASELAKKIKQGRLQDSFTVRDVYRKGWHLLNRKNTELACEELVAAGWLKENMQEAGKQGGRPVIVFRINPKVKK